MKQYKFSILGRLDGLNTVINANRTNKYKGAQIKSVNDQICSTYITKYLCGVTINKPVIIQFDWFEKNRRRDLDNIYSGKKFILDALVKCRVLQNDSQKYVTGLVDQIHTDKMNPRIEVTISEVGGGIGKE